MGAISACEKGIEWQRALGMFVAMRAASVVQDAISYSSAISACEKRGKWQCALCLFVAMGIATVRRDAITYNSAISACEKSSEWEYSWHVRRNAGCFRDTEHHHLHFRDQCLRKRW